MEPQFDSVQSLKAIESNYGPQVAREVVQIFINDYPQKITKLKNAIEQGDAQSIRFSAHDIKSGCLSMGIKPMSALCEKIEHDSATLSKDQMKKMADQLENEYLRISSEYGAYLNLKH